MFELRPFQTQALERLKARGHLLVIAPTGSGKSLIIDHSLDGERTVLITPLIALNRQHEARLAEHVSKGVLKIVSPEGFVKRFGSIEDWDPTFVVFDECHTYFEWGMTFRPLILQAVIKLKELCQKRPKIKTLWLTATIQKEHQTILQDLWLPFKLRIQGGFELPSAIDFRVLQIPWANRLSATLYWLKFKCPLESGLIFVGSRHLAEKLTLMLRSEDIWAQVYHAGFSNEERRNLEKAILHKEVRVVVATSAFGMGMDLSHLGWVLLWQLPYSILSMAQAIGRVGRRGKRGDAFLFWDHYDFTKLGSTEAQGELVAFIDDRKCRVAWLSFYFNSQKPTLPCGRCDLCQLGSG